MKRTIFLYVSLFTFYVLLPQSSFATSVGLNVIKYPGTSGYVPNNQLKNWMVFIPDSPSDLTGQASQVSPNAVIRIHSNWTDIGKNMLGSPTQQSQAASQWCSALNTFAGGKQQVFVEPFNELDKDYERASPEGNLDLNLGITRAKSFITKLRSCLNSSITVTSPAIDPLNSNSAIIIDRFASDFNVISYHPYDTDHAHNYNSGALSGKRFIFTETGVVKNGKVVYDDCEFIKFYCGENITDYWQKQSDIIAYFLFTESPGDYNGTAWKFTNKNVGKALLNDCSDILSCTPENPNNGSSPENQFRDDLFPDINIGANVHQSAPQGFLHYEAPDPQAFSNNPTNACSSQLTITEKFDPKKVGGTGPGSSNFQQYDVNEVSKTVEGGGPYSNYALRGSSIHYAKMYPLNVEYHETAKVINNRFTSYEDQAFGAIVHSMPYADQLYLRGRLIEDVARSLEPDPSKKSDVIPVDEQIAWACGESLKNLFPKPEGNDCRPITSSEVAYYFSSQGDSTSYEIGENYTPMKTPFPQDAARLAAEYYHCPAEDEGIPLSAGGSRQCGYFKTYPDAKRIMGGVFSPLSSYDAYSLLYNAINVVPRGSVSASLEVDNVENGGTIVTKKTNNVLPLAAPISSEQVGYAVDYYTPYQGSTTINANYCSNPSPNEPSQDSTSPFSILAFFRNFIETIFGEPKTISKQVASRYNLPQTMTQNMPKDESFLQYMLPQDDQNYYNYASTAQSSYVKGDDETAKSLPQPGLKDASLRNSMNLYLKPYEWTSSM